jgi:hypothetical protein
MHGYSQVGKTIVIYAENNPRVIMKEISEMILKFRGSGPRIPFAKSICSNLPIYYRFGSYESFYVTLGDRTQDDDRSSQTGAVPAGVNDVFEDMVEISPVDDSENLVDQLIKQFPVIQTLQQTGKSGVFLSINLNNPHLRPVILKIGYKNGAIQGNSLDGKSYVAREINMYKRLKLLCLEKYCPDFVDSVVDDDAVLVITYIFGVNLAQKHRAEQLELKDLESSWRIINEFHNSGIVLHDAKLANFVEEVETGKVFIVDLEMAQPADQPSNHLKKTYVIGGATFADAYKFDLAHFLASVLCPKSQRTIALGEHIAMDDLRAAASDLSNRAVAQWALDRVGEITDVKIRS